MNEELLLSNAPQPQVMSTEEWTSHYEGRSEIAKQALATVKSTHTGASYISWSVMYVVLKKLDPFVQIIKVPNETGGFAHIQESRVVVNEYKELKDKTGQTIEFKEEHIDSVNRAMFVKVKIIFRGVEYTEDYPVRNKQGLGAVFVEGMLINNALQRAMAKLASTITGVGFALWTREEWEDIQEIEGQGKPLVETPKAVAPKVEEPKVEKPKVEKPKPAPKVEAPKVEAPPVEEPKELNLLQADVNDHLPDVNNDTLPPHYELAELIATHSNEPYLATLIGVFNRQLSVVGQTDIVLGQTDVQEMATKLSHLKNVGTTLTAVKKKLGL